MKWEKEREGASGGREIERWGGAESNEDAGKKGVKTWKQLTTPGIPFMPWMAVRNKISSVADATYIKVNSFECRVGCHPLCIPFWCHPNPMKKKGKTDGKQTGAGEGRQVRHIQ